MSHDHVAYRFSRRSASWRETTFTTARHTHPVKAISNTEHDPVSISLRITLLFQIRTARLILRDIVEEDTPLIQQMAQEPAIIRYQSWLKLDSEEEVRQWVHRAVFHNTQQPRDAYNLIVVERGTHQSIGWIGWGHSDDPTYGEYSFGYALLPKYWGRGYMTEALQAGITFMFETLQAQAITDYCDSSNEASRRVMEKAGMTQVAQWTEETGSGVTVEYLRFAIQKSEWSQPLGGPGSIHCISSDS